jgi:hypothetical protein
VTYVSSFNGEVLPEEGRIVLEHVRGVAEVRTIREGVPIEGSPVETGFIDFGTRRTFQTAKLRDGTRSTVETPFADLPAVTETAEIDTILGHECRRATAVVRSNRIDLWFTRDAGFPGSPSLNLIVDGALVLKVVRNGNYVIEAMEVPAAEPADTASSSSFGLYAQAAWGDRVDLATYRSRSAASYVTTIPIFGREAISFGNEIENPAPTDSQAVFRYAGGTVIVRRVVLPEVPDDTAVFAEIVEVSNGDAYDRTGSVFFVPGSSGAIAAGALGGERLTLLDALRDGIALLPVTRDRAGREYQGVVATERYVPPVELVRFITPFGVGHYNSQVTVAGIAWEDSSVYKMEVTDLLPALRGPVWIGAFIGNYDKGGHRLSLSLRYHPGSREVNEAPHARKWVQPLFCTLNLMEMAGQSYARLFEEDTLRATFDLPPGIENVRLRYITTGHGGWGEGDEFLPKINEIRVDGRIIGRFAPWRADC